MIAGSMDIIVCEKERDIEIHAYHGWIGMECDCQDLWIPVCM